MGSLYADTILMNGYAEIGNVSGWNHNGVTVNNDPVYGGRHFAMHPGGYMLQKIPLTAIARASSSYMFTLHYFRNRDIIVTDGYSYAELLIRIASGVSEDYMLPIQGASGKWNVVEIIVDIPDDSELSDMDVRIYNNEEDTLRVDNIQLLPSRELADTGGGSGNFTDEAIMYGLEEDLPRLGGY